MLDQARRAIYVSYDDLSRTGTLTVRVPPATGRRFGDDSLGGSLREDEAHVVDLNLPRHTDEGGSTVAIVVMMPFTVALDVATSPFQGAALLFFVLTYKPRMF